MKRNYLIFILVAVGLVLLVAGGIFIFFSSQPTTPTAQPVASEESAPRQEVTKPVEEPEPYSGQDITVDNGFTVKVPNGWSASVSNSPSFLAIMFARPQQLSSLVYNPTTAPNVDYNGIPAWSGLTEHFYIRAVSAGQYFDPAAHQEVSSETFTFDDGTIGQKYFVVKHAGEAAQYGGLLKDDDEWQGRVYVYEKDGKRVEAHIAVYPSSGHDIDFYEKVVRSIKTSA